MLLFPLPLFARLLSNHIRNEGSRHVTINRSRKEKGSTVQPPTPLRLNDCVFASIATNMLLRYVRERNQLWRQFNATSAASTFNATFRYVLQWRTAIIKKTQQNIRSPWCYQLHTDAPNISPPSLKKAAGFKRHSIRSFISHWLRHIPSRRVLCRKSTWKASVKVFRNNVNHGKYWEVPWSWNPYEWASNTVPNKKRDGLKSLPACGRRVVKHQAACSAKRPKRRKGAGKFLQLWGHCK